MFLSHESLLADVAKFVEAYRKCCLGKSCFAPFHRPKFLYQSIPREKSMLLLQSGGSTKGLRFPCMAKIRFVAVTFVLTYGMLVVPLKYGLNSIRSVLGGC